MQPRDYFDLNQSTRDDIRGTLTKSERIGVVVLPDLGRPTKKDLEKAMEGQILAEAELVGTYQRSR